MVPMTSDADIRGLLERALGQAAAVIAAIPAGAAGAATPCPGWDVRTLVRHVVGQDLRNFIAAIPAGAAGTASPAARTRTGRRPPTSSARTGWPPSPAARTG